MKSGSVIAPNIENEDFYIAQSTLPGAGNGLFTKRKIKKGEIIGYFDGELIEEAEAISRDKGIRGHYFVQLSSGKILDTYYYESFARYVNDARDKKLNNARIYSSETGTEAYISAIKNIEAGAEVFVDYGKQYWDTIELQQG